MNPNKDRCRAVEKIREEDDFIIRCRESSHMTNCSSVPYKSETGTKIISFNNPAQKDNPSGFDGMIGRSSKMLAVYEEMTDVASIDIPVHVSGKTGTGKELVASAIHQLSTRRKGPFVPVNCGALPEGLFESEFFGHVKGAFSGAVRDKKGRVQLADGGTLFLDEISELSGPMQVKLLRFLQDGIFERVGEETPRSVNVRIISACNKNLKHEVNRRRFRKDLFYRVHVFPVCLPELRERRDDIPLLVHHFINETVYLNPAKRVSVSEDTMDILDAYPWPGNVRELQNAIFFAFIKCRTDTILPRDLPPDIKNTLQVKPAKANLKRKK